MSDEKINPAFNVSDVKPLFKERYSKLTDYPEFIKYCGYYLNTGIRVNTLKISVDELRKRLSTDWNLKPVPWCKEGFWISSKTGRRDIGNLIEHSLGYIYVQEPASMIPPIVLNPSSGDIVLDMCAAPGSKTTQIGQYMGSKGLLVSNDLTGDRMAPLGINVQRMGLTNCVVTKMNGGYFGRLVEIFDKVLVDAPCSAVGNIRKTPRTVRIWNPNAVKKLSGIQKDLISAGFTALKKGGVLVYSTCTLEPEENEGVVNWLITKYPNAKVEKIDLNIKHSGTVLEFDGVKYDPSVANCLRIWPQDNDTEGFFVAKIRKE